MICEKRFEIYEKYVEKSLIRVCPEIMMLQKKDFHNRSQIFLNEHWSLYCVETDLKTIKESTRRKMLYEVCSESMMLKKQNFHSSYFSNAVGKPSRGMRHNSYNFSK